MDEGQRKTNEIFWPRLSQVRILFKIFIEKLNQTKFLIVFIDECSFNPTTIRRYSWMKRGEPTDKLIRDTTNWYNSIAAQWDKFVHFVLKTETSNEDNIWGFMNLLIKQLRLTVNKNQLEYKTVIL